MGKKRRHSQIRDVSDSTDDVPLSEEAGNQEGSSTLRPISNPWDVARDLFKALEDYKTDDSKVLCDLRTIMNYDSEFVEPWILKMREKWEITTPQTADDATKLVWYALVDLHDGLVPAYIQDILSHYNLPRITEVDGGNFILPFLSLSAPAENYDGYTEDEVFCFEQYPEEKDPMPGVVLQEQQHESVTSKTDRSSGSVH